MIAELEHWHDFYVLVGTAGATLLALLFVAVSLGAGFLDDSRAAPTRAFYSPWSCISVPSFFLPLSRWCLRTGRLSSRR